MKLLAYQRSGGLPQSTRRASLKAVSSWNLMQKLHLASTLKAYAPAELALLVNPHPNCAQILQHRSRTQEINASKTKDTQKGRGLVMDTGQCQICCVPQTGCP